MNFNFFEILEIKILIWGDEISILRLVDFMFFFVVCVCLLWVGVCNMKLDVNVLCYFIKDEFCVFIVVEMGMKNVSYVEIFLEFFVEFMSVDWIVRNFVCMEFMSIFVLCSMRLCLWSLWIVLLVLSIFVNFVFFL